MDSDPNRQLKDEFNRWANAGKGESMGRHHLAITQKAIARMGIETGDRVLDLGCGNGWASRLLAPKVGPRGLVVGVDISDAMIREAQQHSEQPRNVRFLCAPAERIPWDENFFTHVLSVESLYYYPDPAAVLRELLRVVAPGGRVFFLICIYKGNERTAHWIDKLDIPVQFLTPAEYQKLFTDAGWANATAEEFLPAPGDDDEHAQALLLSAQKK